MFTLLGLLCMDPTLLESCTQKVWVKEGYFPTQYECEFMGNAQIGLQSPYGIVVSFTCKQEGEPA